MAFKDLLLHIASYPDPTPNGAIEAAVRFAGLSGGKLTALALQVDIPLHSNRIADFLVHLTSLAQAKEARSLAACRDSLAHFAAVAAPAGVFEATLMERCDLYGVAEHVARRARSRDLCLVPVTAAPDGQAHVAHSVIFESGRPALVFQAEAAPWTAADLGEVVLAWDGGRSAARALADALPLLQRAGAVRVLTILNEKPQAAADIGRDVLRHLSTHGVDAEIDEVDSAGAPIGAVLHDYLQRRAPDLLVRGAYGHSRLREFVLGGATAHILHAPPVPVFMAH
jgi:nucleotide-binding universal stress UspA family protein